MRKEEFITTLRNKLAGLPKKEVEDRLSFYGEMIDDRMEEGLTEEEAVADIGTVEEVAEEIIKDIPLLKIAKERIKPTRKLKAWEIVLLTLGSPIWLSLVIAAFAVVISLFAVVWSLVISVWAIFISLAACAVGGVLAGIVIACTGQGLTGVALVGAGIVCAGLAVFFFFACKATTKGGWWLTKKMLVGIKRCFVKKEKI